MPYYSIESSRCRLKRAPADEHAWSDSEDRYGRDYDYDDRRSAGRGPPPLMHQQQGQSRGFAPMYPPPPMQSGSSRDNRYMPMPPPPPPPPHMNYGYMNYDHRPIPPPPPPIVKFFLIKHVEKF